MAVAGVGNTAVFQTPGAQPVQPKGPPPAPPANDDVDRPPEAKKAEAPAPNTSPSEDERKQAEEAGRTRGSFVNIQA